MSPKAMIQSNSDPAPPPLAGSGGVQIRRGSMKDNALKVAGVIFLLVSIVHLLRVILRTQVTIAGFVLPIGASVFGFIISLLLSLWMFKSLPAGR